MREKIGAAVCKPRMRNKEPFRLPHEEDNALDAAERRTLADWAGIAVSSILGRNGSEKYV